ncbi:MAG: hypothetical protein IJC84_04935 [Clostridia bacterium]|nr:hypothetical protein [Clostridia bacterium]
MNFKRILALLLTVSVLIALISCTVAEESEAKESGSHATSAVETDPAESVSETQEEQKETKELDPVDTQETPIEDAPVDTQETPIEDDPVDVTASTSTTKPPVTTTRVTTTAAPTTSGAYGRGESYTPAIKNNLTLSQVNSVPVVKEGMSAGELRDICWDFMTLQMNVGWKVSAGFTAMEGSNKQVHKVNTLYGGMPYSSSTFNNLYQFMYYYDSATGYMDLTALQNNTVAATLKDSGQKDLVALQLGNQCSASSLWAWSRVSNAISWNGTSNVLPVNGAIFLGDLHEAFKSKYGSVTQFTDSTASFLASLPKETVYAAYAMLQKADGLVYNAGKVGGSGGHVMMVHKVDVANQRIYIQDQTTRGVGKVGLHGGSYRYFTFAWFLERGAIPFTIPEFVGQSPVENGFATFSHSGATVNVTQLLAAKIDSNYMISDVTVKVMNGNEVVGKHFYTTTVNLSLYAAQSADKIAVSLKHSDRNKNLGATSSQYEAYVGKGYQVRVDVRISTGEVFTVYNGTLA